MVVQQFPMCTSKNITAVSHLCIYLDMFQYVQNLQQHTSVLLKTPTSNNRLCSYKLGYNTCTTM